MAVPCAHCGREYDVALFGFGRTIWCTCGGRVGPGPRRRRLRVPTERRFIADAMLGKLARWLRLLGFDCAYDSEIADEDLVRRGIAEERIILSRDRALPEEWWTPRIYLIHEESLRHQLRELIRRFDLAASVRLLSRCSECNRVLEPVAEADVRERVPARVLATHDAFSECRECRRVYWEGSHTERIRRVVDDLLTASCPALAANDEATKIATRMLPKLVSAMAGQLHRLVGRRLPSRAARRDRVPQACLQTRRWSSEDSEGNSPELSRRLRSSRTGGPAREECP